MMSRSWELLNLFLRTMYHVYILYSDALGKYYTGSCSDINKRLAEHNKGQSRYTKSGIPWGIVKDFEAANRREALKLEARIKKRGAKRFLLDLD
ncbi:GIY-YIG nuclease family protein [Parapedobacter tibetensis]|uniref:GIY-YIG nuclease family protein n=1 Tax=Parapedobacter tibetensis TaxID=2972951 RepID=UPI00356B6C4D